MKRRYLNWNILAVLFFAVMITYGCDKTDDCSRIDRIGGGLLPEQDIEVPCDFPEPLPIGVLDKV
ncbi:hypothetical protein LCGC14_2107380 [marine sediment metagenome]|uniref:Uncharacterized protein n=2 Tax=root TaxID=1 RepID=A0A831VSR6_9FLAO|nr:hypothetical protein [Pricia antarctica]